MKSHLMVKYHQYILVYAKGSDKVVLVAFGRRSSFFYSVGMKFSLLRFRDLCSEGSSV